MPTRNQLVLQENHPRAFNGAGGAELRAVSGIVWITESGAADDVFLRAGEHHRILRKGRVAVSYTHLDVYKRQPVCRPADWWTGTARTA